MGSKNSKCMLWLKRVNEDPNVNHIKILGDLVQELMDLNMPHRQQEQTRGRDLVRNALQNCGLVYQPGGVITPAGKPGATGSGLDNESASDHPFPMDKDAFLSTLAEILKVRGSVREVYLLATGSADIDQASSESWSDRDFDGWKITIKLIPRVYARLSEDAIKESCEKILKAAREVIRTVPDQGIETVTVAPEVNPRSDWKEDDKRWVKGEGVNNQGRVRSDKLPGREEDGLLFRSWPEIHFYKALKEKGVAFAPLPVFLHGGEKYRRIEPDFVLVKDGVLMIVELDGDHFHTETPAEADTRLNMLKHEGARIEHISASECATPEKAKICAGKVLALMEKLLTVTDFGGIVGECGIFNQSHHYMRLPNSADLASGLLARCADQN